MSATGANDKSQKKRAKRSLFASLIKRIDNFIERLDVKMASKLTIAAILSLYLSYAFSYYFKHPDFIIADLWCVMTSIVVLQTTIGGTYKAIWLRFIGILVGSLTGVFFASVWGAETISLGMAVFTTVIVCAIFKIPDSYRLAALSVVVVMLPWKAHPENSPWTYAFFRFIDTCFGFLAAIIVSHIIWPSLALSNIRSRMADRIDLYLEFFSLLLKPQNLEERQQLAIQLYDEIENSPELSQHVLEESRMELMMHSDLFSIWIELIKCQALLWESLRVLENVYSAKLDEVFDDVLRRHVKQIMEAINLALKEISLELKNEKATFNIDNLANMQRTLSQQMLRFRATQRIRNYGLDIVEDYFVFFYELDQILKKLQNFHRLLDLLNEGST